VSWSDAVDEALCVGWIDSVRYSLDAERSAQRFTPRRKGSIWSAVNVAKVAEAPGRGADAARRRGGLRPSVATTGPRSTRSNKRGIRSWPPTTRRASGRTRQRGPGSPRRLRRSGSRRSTGVISAKRPEDPRSPACDIDRIVGGGPADPADGLGQGRGRGAEILKPSREFSWGGPTRRVFSGNPTVGARCSRRADWNRHERAHLRIEPTPIGANSSGRPVRRETGRRVGRRV